MKYPKRLMVNGEQLLDHALIRLPFTLLFTKTLCAMLCALCDYGQLTSSTLLLGLNSVTDLFADTAAAAKMFIDADEGAFLFILTVGKSGTAELIQASSAHIALVRHPEDNLLLFAGHTPFK